MKNKILKLELSVEEINLILSSLSEMPYKVSASLITKIQEQARKQLIEVEENSPKSV